MLPLRQEDGKNSQSKRRKPRLVSQEGQVPVPCLKGQRGRTKVSMAGPRIHLVVWPYQYAGACRCQHLGRELPRQAESKSAGGSVVQETPRGRWRRGFDRETGRGCWAGSGTGMTESLAQVNVSCWAEQTGLASTTTEAVLGSDSGRQRHL